MPYRKLNTSFETKNILGVSQEDLDKLTMDPYYEYVQLPGVSHTFDRGGETLSVDLIELDIRRYEVVFVEVNPELFEYGLVTFNPVLGSGRQTPRIHIRAHTKGEVDLPWVARLRLHG